MQRASATDLAAVARRCLAVLFLALLLAAGAVEPARAQGLVSLTLSSSTVVAGQSTGGTVTLDAVAPPGGVEVALASSNGLLVALPSSVTVAEGATSAPFTATTNAVLVDTPITLSGTLEGVTRTAALTLRPGAVALLTVSPQAVQGGDGATGRVVLGCSAPPGGALVSLASGNGAVASVPGSITVPAGATTVSFPIATGAVAETTEVVILALYQGATATATLSLLADVPLSLHLTEGLACAGGAATGTVKLRSPAPDGGVVVSLSSDYPAAVALPDSVSLDAGATSASFPLVLQAGADLPTVLGISATLEAVTVRDSITLLPAGYLAEVDLSEHAICAGRPVIGTVRLGCPAPLTGTTVTLTSSDGVIAVVPPSVTLPAGATSASFPVIGGAVPVDSAVVITAAVGCFARQTTLVVRPILLASFKLSAPSVCAGNSVTGTIRLTCPAPAGGALVTLTSDKPTAAVVPSPVIVPAGAMTVSFPVTSVLAVPVSTPVTLKASYGGVSEKADLTVQPLTLLSLSLDASEICAVPVIAGKVTLSCTAPPGGTVVALTSSKPGVASVPASVTVPVGATSAEFAVTRHDVAGSVVVKFTASYAGVSKQSSLTVDPFRLATFSLSAGSSCAGTSVVGTVALSCTAARLGAVVTLSSTNGAATVPSTVAVLPGHDTATFEVVTHPVLTATAVTLKATFGGVTKPVSLTVMPIALASLTVAPPAVPGGTASKGTVRLACPAPAGGAAVALTSSNPGRASVPATVTVPEGATEASFPISTTHALLAASVTIKATRVPVSKQAILLVLP